MTMRPEEIAEIRRLAEAGAWREEVRAVFGISRNCLIQLQKKHALNFARAPSPRRPPGGAWWQAEGRLDRLREAWERGDTGVAIAAALGTTKNAVIGMANRLCLAARWTPPPVPAPRAYPFEPVGPQDCRWPLGHPREPDFHFCARRIEADLPDGPYCAEHRARAYVRAREIVE